MPPLGVARMAKGGVGLDPSKTTGRSTGRFSRLVYAERYLYKASLQRKLPNFGLGRPTRGAEQGKNDTKPPHTQKTKTKAKEHNQHRTNTNNEEKRNRREGPKTNANQQLGLTLRTSETTAELHI